MKRTLAALASMASALSLAGVAHAAVYDLTLDHCTNPCGPQASFGTITTSVDGDNTGMDVSVMLLNGNSFTNTEIGVLTIVGSLIGAILQGVGSASVPLVQAAIDGHKEKMLRL